MNYSNLDQDLSEIVNETKSYTVWSFVFKKGLLQLIFAFAVPFGVNFAIGYFLDQDEERYAFETMNAAFLGFIFAGLLNCIAQHLIESYLFEKEIRQMHVESPFVLEDMNTFSQGYLYLFPSLKVRSRFLRAILLGIQAVVYFSFPCIIAMVAWCSKSTDCSMSRLTYSLLIGIFCGVESLLLHPIAVAAALYHIFSEDSYTPLVE